MTDLILLATLLPGPKHGYQLKREAGFILGQEAIHNNLVYPLLRRFTEQGWVTKRTVPGERGQKRHQYVLTVLGRKTLIARLSEYTEAEAKSPEGFLTRVGLFQLLDPAIRQKILDGRAAHLQKTTDHLAKIEEHFRLGPYSRETTHFLQSQVKAELKWIQHLRKITKPQSKRRKS
jgi:DNA-binding PadR family transcriptional regulator